MNQEVHLELDVIPLWPAVLLNFFASVDPEAVANEIYNLQAADPEGRLKSNFGGWQSKIIRAPKFEDVLPAISSVRQICSQAVSEACLHQWPEEHREVSMCQWWANINKPGEDFNVNHHHGDAYMSAVYYAQVPENPGKLLLESPVVHGNSAWHGIKHFTPKAGQVLMFPGSYRHMVLPTGSTEGKDRISIAFNFDIED